MKLKNHSFKGILKFFALMMGLVGLMNFAHADLEEAIAELKACRQSNDPVSGTDAEIQATAQKICKDMDAVHSSAPSCQSAVDTCAEDVYNFLWRYMQQFGSECRLKFHHTFECEPCAYAETIYFVETKTQSPHKSSITNACKCGNGQLDAGESCDPKGFSSTDPFQQCTNSCTLISVAPPNVSTPPIEPTPLPDPVVSETKVVSDQEALPQVDKINVGATFAGCSMAQIQGAVSPFSVAGLTLSLPTLIFSLIRRKKKK